MGFSRVLRAVGGAALAGALVVCSAPVAQASDGARKEQWALKAYGAESNLVWNHSTGKGVTVAVIDSGVRATHVDLAGQILPGTDFVYGGNGQSDHSSDGHGTGIASLIAGHGHGSNGEDGIMGLAPGVKILPIGIGNGDFGSMPVEVLSKAIRYAVDHGAQVINMSLGGLSSNPVDQDAVAYAEKHNVVLVAAVGNDGISAPEYPAAYPGVIGVGAVDKSVTLWPRSETGAVTVVGAGVKIVRDGAASDTQMWEDSGTSYSTAYVSAIAALFRSAYPNLTQGQIVNRIIKTAIMPAGHTAPDPGLGYGVASPDFKTNVPAGPANGPLPQASGLPDPNASTSTTNTASSSSSSSSKSSLVLIGLGVVGGLIVLVIIIVVIARSRRGGGGGGGTPGGGTPVGPSYPQAQPPYPQQQPAYQPPSGQFGPPGGQYGQQNPYGGGQPPQQGYGGQR